MGIIDVSNTVYDTALFKYGFPIMNKIVHSALHIKQQNAYISIDPLYIPKSVLSLETPIHFLAYFYTFVYFSRNMNMLSLVAFLNIISWITGLKLVFTEYVSGTIHEHMSYFLTSLMGAHCVHMLFNVYRKNSMSSFNFSYTYLVEWIKNTKLGISYFIFSYAYLAGWLIFLSTYDDFVKYNHFMELSLTGDFLMMTMASVYIYRDLLTDKTFLNYINNIYKKE